MQRGRNDDWDRPPEQGMDQPRGLSGPTKDLPPGDEAAWSGIDPLKGQLQREGGLFAAAVAGLLAAAVGVAVWVVLSWQTERIFPVMLLGIGYLVGMAVRWVGRGSRSSMGLLAAGITLVACLAGMVLSIAAVIARGDGVPIRDVLEAMDMGSMLQTLGQSATPLSMLLFLFALYESYRMAVVSPRLPPTSQELGEQGQRED